MAAFMNARSAVAPSPAISAPWKIHAGLFPRAVLQRNLKGVSESRIAGRAPGATDGWIIVTVTGGSRNTQSRGQIILERHRIARCRKGEFECLLKGVPAGGPYTIKLEMERGRVPAWIVEDVLVGDLWICAGQSNMEGVGRRHGVDLPNHPEVRACLMDDRWELARDPIHNTWAAADRVHLRGSDQGKGVGPAVAFGVHMRRQTGVPQGLIPCAHGGTSMDQWSPSLRGQGGRSLYGSMMRRFHLCGGKVAGVIWYQGESDAFPEASDSYGGKIKRWISACRKDLRDDRLPMVIVQIGRVVGRQAHRGWSRVREEQRLLSSKVARVAVVPTIDLDLDDLIHISGKDQQRLGIRVADAMLSLVTKDTHPSPSLEKIQVIHDPTTKQAVIRVVYKNVQGGLTAGNGTAWGYTLVDHQDAPVDAIYSARLEGNIAELRTVLPLAEASALRLAYGFGCNPCTNVRDGSGQAIPAFGPLSLGGKPRHTTPFALQCDISAFQPSAGRLETLAYPAPPANLGWQKRTFSDRFLNRRPEIMKFSGDAVLYYRFRIGCPMAMRISLFLGYDGPLKVWWDGRLAFHDPMGTNPAIIDAREVPLSVQPGSHELIIALATNHGQAWGIFLRMMRNDVPPKARPGTVLLPVWE
jgi:sialate O-acetylesterase